MIGSNYFQNYAQGMGGQFPQLAGLAQQQQALPSAPLPGVGGFSNPSLNQDGYIGGLIDNTSGTPSYVPSLYQSSPEYKKAWDDVSQRHHQQFGQGYGKYSDTSMLLQQLNSALNNNPDFTGFDQIVNAGSTGANAVNRDVRFPDVQYSPDVQQMAQGTDQNAQAAQMAMGQGPNMLKYLASPAAANNKWLKG